MDKKENNFDKRKEKKLNKDNDLKMDVDNSTSEGNDSNKAEKEFDKFLLKKPPMIPSSAVKAKENYLRLVISLYKIDKREQRYSASWEST